MRNRFDNDIYHGEFDGISNIGEEVSIAMAMLGAVPRGMWVNGVYIPNGEPSIKTRKIMNRSASHEIVEIDDPSEADPGERVFVYEDKLVKEVLIDP